MKQESKKSSRNLREEFLTLLESGLRTAGRVTKREFDRVAELTRDKLEKKYGKEKLDEFTERAKANWREMADKIEQARVRIEAEESFRKGKQIGVQLLDGLATAIKRAAENLEASLSDKVTYHSGQIVDKGVYVCV